MEVQLSRKWWSMNTLYTPYDNNINTSGEDCALFWKRNGLHDCIIIIDSNTGCTRFTRCTYLYLVHTWYQVESLRSVSQQEINTQYNRYSHALQLDLAGVAMTSSYSYNSSTPRNVWYNQQYFSTAAVVKGHRYCPNYCREKRGLVDDAWRGTFGMKSLLCENQ